MALNILQARASTTATLAGSGTFTSGAQHATMDASHVSAVAYADVAGTLYIDQSIDGTNWDLSSSVVVPAGTGTALSVELVAAYWRVRYVNGATAQGTFRLAAYQRAI